MTSTRCIMTSTRAVPISWRPPAPVTLKTTGPVSNPYTVALEAALDAYGIPKALWSIIVEYRSSTDVRYWHLFQFTCKHLVVDPKDYTRRYLEQRTMELITHVIRPHSAMGATNITQSVGDSIALPDVARIGYDNDNKGYDEPLSSQAADVAPDLQIAAFKDLGVVIVHDYTRAQPEDYVGRRLPGITILDDDVYYVHTLIGERLGRNSPWHAVMAAAEVKLGAELSTDMKNMLTLARLIRAYHAVPDPNSAEAQEAQLAICVFCYKTTIARHPDHPDFVEETAATPVNDAAVASWPPPPV